ncbi:nodulate formation efficiency C protein [Bradyrhizobium sp. WSM 1744]|uniref:Nodulate formation efficiency C protein n=1 Tax=Bradyrhizobium archetypum TaxID=2721160 RepID=A0A7Y4H1S0_9BRAD|nr:nodulate formation efficiency C protein [Bradyrhizobium archetypum]
MAKVASTWRAQDGQTAEQIFANVSKVAHFIPRGWKVSKAGNHDVVTFSWARHASDQEGDEYTISFEPDRDGAVWLYPEYARPMELGWQAFALSLIDSEVTDQEEGVNVRFMRDLSNFNFVTTAQGKLGEVLRRGRCSVTNDPVHVTYVPSNFKQPELGDYWHIQLQVDCDIPGPTYFTRGGAVLFDKRAKEDWRPASLFARRIAAYAPGHWFDSADPQEQMIFDTAKKALERAGTPTKGLQSPFPR